jgi:hypothetical protein
MVADSAPLIAAVIEAPDGVRFVAAAERAEQIAELLVDYVRGRCDDVLWPAAASRVRALIDAGESYAAIDEYFAEVGSRWDEEWLAPMLIVSRSVGEGQDPSLRSG